MRLLENAACRLWRLRLRTRLRSQSEGKCSAYPKQWNTGGNRGYERSARKGGHVREVGGSCWHGLQQRRKYPYNRLRCQAFLCKSKLDKSV